MNDAADSEDLVARIARGDPRAENELVERFSRAVAMMLRQRCHDAELAADLHQDTFRVLIEKLRRDGLDDPGRLAAYAHRTALNLWRGHYRKEKRRKTDADSESVERLPHPREAQLDTLLREEEGTAVRELLATLRPPRDRDVLRRFYLLQQDKPLICRDLDLSPANFDRVISRARQRFKKLVLARLGDAAAALDLPDQEGA